MLVVGSPNDPATPFSWAEKMAKSLNRSTLLRYDGEGHSSSLDSECVAAASRRVLIELGSPDVTSCPAATSGSQLPEWLAALPSLPGVSDQDVSDIAPLLGLGVVGLTGTARLSAASPGQLTLDVTRTLVADGWKPKAFDTLPGFERTVGGVTQRLVVLPIPLSALEAEPLAKPLVARLKTAGETLVVLATPIA